MAASSSKRILVPTSGYRHAEEGARFAIPIARDLGAEIVALYVIEVPPNLPLHAVIPEDVEKGSHALDKVRQIVRPTGVRVSTKMANARTAAQGILDELAENRYELLVLGISTRGRMKRLLFGNVVEEVLRKATCPVCIVQSAKKPGEK